MSWNSDADGNWSAAETPPACPAQPMVALPADISKVTAVLYPGQTRGGNYKPHGGLRFDHITDNKVAISAPMSGSLVRGARYLVDGQVQYTFDVINSCGVMWRLGHLLTLTPAFQAVADQFPAPVENDSRTTWVNPPVAVTAGQAVATAVGTKNNTFFDFGVYDLRAKNAAAADPAYVAAHDLELSGHAVCWLKGWVPAADSAALLALPAGDPTSGKKSDYCK